MHVLTCPERAAISVENVREIQNNAVGPVVQYWLRRALTPNGGCECGKPRSGLMDSVRT